MCDSLSFYVVCDGKTEKRERTQRKEEEERPCICRFSIPLHPSQSVQWLAHALRELLLERKYRLERKRGRRQAKKQRKRAGVGNPPLHLLVIYSFMFSRHLVKWLVFWCWCSSAHRPSANPRKTGGGQTEEKREKSKRHCIKGKVEPHLDWLIFHLFLFVFVKTGLLFFHFFLEVTFRRKKNTNPINASLSLYTELSCSFYQLLIFLALF